MVLRSALEDLLKDNDLVSIIISPEQALLAQLSDNTQLGHRMLTFAIKGCEIVPGAQPMQKLFVDCDNTLLLEETEKWRELAPSLARYCKNINIAAQTTLSSIPEFVYTQEVNRDEQKDEGTVLTQTEQENHPFDKMGLSAQLFVHETEKSIASTR